MTRDELRLRLAHAIRRARDIENKHRLKHVDMLAAGRVMRELIELGLLDHLDAVASREVDHGA